MKKLLPMLLVLALMLTGCDLLFSEEPEAEPSDEEEVVLTFADALPHIMAAADAHLPLESGVTRSYEYRKRTTRSGETTCYIYNVIDDYGTYRKIAGRYAASADGSVVLWYDIVTDQYLPFE